MNVYQLDIFMPGLISMYWDPEATASGIYDDMIIRRIRNQWQSSKNTANINLQRFSSQQLEAVEILYRWRTPFEAKVTRIINVPIPETSDLSEELAKLDNWFDKLKPLASDCSEILSELKNLEDWQIQLKTLFENMADPADLADNKKIEI